MATGTDVNFFIDPDTGKIKYGLSESREQIMRKPYSVYACCICMRTYEDLAKLLHHKTELQHFLVDELLPVEPAEHGSLEPMGPAENCPIKGVIDPHSVPEEKLIHHKTELQRFLVDDEPALPDPVFIAPPGNGISEPVGPAENLPIEGVTDHHTIPEDLKEDFITYLADLIKCSNDDEALQMEEARKISVSEHTESRLIQTNSPLSVPNTSEFAGAVEKVDVTSGWLEIQNFSNHDQHEEALQIEETGEVAVIGNVLPNSSCLGAEELTEFTGVVVSVEGIMSGALGISNYLRRSQRCIAADSRNDKNGRATNPRSKRPRRKTDPLACKRCSQILKTKHGLVRHMKSFHTFSSTKYSCTICKKILQTKHMLMKHEELHRPEGGGKGFKCPICTKILTTRTGVKHHIQNFHTKGSFQCQKCEKSLMTKHALEKHKNVCFPANQIHAGYTCNICSKVLSTRSSLKIHVEIHTRTPRERFQCQRCDKSYLWKANLKRHSKNVHGSEVTVLDMRSCGVVLQRITSIHSRTSRERFQCPKCDKSYISKANLKRHSKNVHGHHQGVDFADMNSCCVVLYRI